MQKQNTTNCAMCRFCTGEHTPFSLKYICNSPIKDDDIYCPHDKYEIESMRDVQRIINQRNS